ncbi:chemotaxis protein CheX [Ammoniphilus sp. YIM 78166]|uniref:chemotaxis protein CheX n=1 Tax=Ammoniphilus sp. YIM 78166 TaxID=1644106 RepID=UPI0014317A3E|nr:chemotaxis protein CheX [Ammoniphilus sp. YIM 78166]
MDEKYTPVINGMIDSITNVIPFPLAVHDFTWFQSPLFQEEIGVLLSLTGDLHVRFVLEGEMGAFSKLGEKMFGMKLEDQLLESFAGELGNMLVGHLSTYLSSKGLRIDITPPTIMVGKTKLYGFDQGVCIPFEMDDMGVIRMNIIIDSKE